jgi:acyl carrier protein
VDAKVIPEREELKRALKQLIVTECQKEFPPDSIEDDELLLGSTSKLELDSLDALQISLAVQQRFGKRIEGNNETRMALKSINSLADYILS